MQIAQDYINKNFNAKYILDSIICNEQIGYIITFSKHICGYPTEDSIGFTVDFDGNICFMNAATGVFDKFEIKNIDESKLIEKLEAQIGGDATYSIRNKRLSIKENTVVMEYQISFPNSMGLVYYIPIE